MSVFDKMAVGRVTKACAAAIAALDLDAMEREFLAAVPGWAKDNLVYESAKFVDEADAELPERAAALNAFLDGWEDKFVKAMAKNGPVEAKEWFGMLFALKLFSDAAHFRGSRQYPDPEKLLLQETAAQNLEARLKRFVAKHKLAVTVSF